MMQPTAVTLVTIPGADATRAGCREPPAERYPAPEPTGGYS